MDKAKHIIEDRLMTADEYLQYRNENKKFISLADNLRCPECGTPVCFVNGEKKSIFFKHSPKKAKPWCSLFHSGVNPTLPEMKIRKKLSEEIDLTFNYELAYINGKWHSYISIPAFSKEELKIITKNNIYLEMVVGNRVNILCDINDGFFSSNEIKKIGIEGFPIDINLRVVGESNELKDKSIDITLDGLKPGQIYSYLLLQDYTKFSKSSTIDLSNIKSFNIKRQVGKIYTGRHYVIVEPDLPGRINIFKGLSAEIKEFKFNYQKGFKKKVYDICFDKITDDNIRFCMNRLCSLNAYNNVEILWPPVVTIGNNKYSILSDNIYFTSETEYECDALKQEQLKNEIIKIKNENETPFYVAKISESTKELLGFIKPKYEDVEIIEETSTYEINENDSYLFINNVLNKKLNCKINTSLKLSRNMHILEMENRISNRIFILPSQKDIDDFKIKNIVRYGKKYVEFNDVAYSNLKKYYKSNEFLDEYLKHSLRVGVIKKEIVDYLMEVNNEV